MQNYKVIKSTKKGYNLVVQLWLWHASQLNARKTTTLVIAKKCRKKIGLRLKLNAPTVVGHLVTSPYTNGVDEVDTAPCMHMNTDM